MAQSYFIWKDTNSRAKNIRLASAVPIVWPEERVKHIQIPGASGDLTILEGDDIYNPYIQTASISVLGAANSAAVKKWLTGTGYVTFSAEPERRQQARVIGAVTLDRASRNLDIWRGNVQFYCQPLKERLTTVTTTVSVNGTITNGGDVAEWPVYTLTATGTTVVLRGLTITGVTSGQSIVIDTAAQMVTINGANGMAKTSGDFNSLPVGGNTVSGSGWSTATVTRRERFF